MSTHTANTVGPHHFHALGVRDALHGNGRCKHCFLPRSAHPVHNAWVPARPIGNKRKAERTWENLHD